MENSRHRDNLINTTGEQYGSARDFLDRKKNEMKQHEERLERDRKNNKEQEDAIISEERKVSK